MPVILHPESYDAWLCGDAEPLGLKRLLLPYPVSEMISHPVGSDVNKPAIGNPNLVKRVEESAGENLSLFKCALAAKGGVRELPMTNRLRQRPDRNPHAL